MSVHLSDRALLRELIGLAEIVLSNPLAFGPGNAFDALALAGDITAAIRCPSPGSAIGVFEATLFGMIERIATGTAWTNGAELMRAAAIASTALAQVREHYSAIIIRETRP